jgi:hypothetical protein
MEIHLSVLYFSWLTIDFCPGERERERGRGEIAEYIWWRQEN